MQADTSHITATPKGEITRADVKLVIRSTALFVASFETLLRQLEPSITLGQLTALDIVVHSGTVRPFRLGQQMMISRQLAWQTCKRLQALGLVTMTEQQGQTGVDVAATDAGVSLLQSVAVIYERLANRLSQQDQVLDVSPAKAALVALATTAGSLAQPETLHSSEARLHAKRVQTT